MDFVSRVLAFVFEVSSLGSPAVPLIGLACGLVHAARPEEPRAQRRCRGVHRVLRRGVALQGLGFGVQGLGFRVWRLSFRV